MSVPLSPEARRRFQELLDLPEAELFAQIGDVAGKTYEGEPDLVRRGRAVLSQIRTSLHQKICVDWDYCSKAADPDFNDEIVLAAAIADLIAPICGLVPATQVAVLLVKQGLHRFCNCGGSY